MNLFTKTEESIVLLISKRWSLEAISRKLAIQHGTLRVHVGNIRQKMGGSTLSPQNLKPFLSPKTRKPELSKSELEVMELRAAGKPFREIAEIRKCALSTAVNLSSRACLKLGLTGTTDTAQIVEALARIGTQPKPPTNAIPHNSKNPYDY